MVPIYPCLKKNTCYHPLVVAIISFVRSIIREEKEKKFPNTKKFPTTLRFILSSVDPSLKNSHVTRVKPTVRQITWRIEKPFNLIDSNSKDARCIRVWKRAKRMLIRTRDWNELKSWIQFQANICCLEDRSKLISLFVNDYFVISLPLRFIRARLEYVFFA